MGTLRTLVGRYRDAFRDEPKLRAYALASFVDDIGVAVSTWAMMLLSTNLFSTQRARASVMLPTLVCFPPGRARRRAGGPRGRPLWRFGLFETAPPVRS